MITKIDSIKRLAVYKDFNWDNEVIKPNNSIENFDHINILYGQNYSGKTTLSRLFRALETKKLSSKYRNPDFKISFNDSSEINQTNFQQNNQLVRVFNEDFIRDNLKFITNPDENIESFALLGGDNIKRRDEIELLEQEIGLQDEGSETGLYADLAKTINAYHVADSEHESVKKTLDVQIRAKAIGRENGIKYSPELYGDQNYTQQKLFNEIAYVLSDDYQSQTNAELKECNDLIHEKAIEKEIPKLPNQSPNILNLSTQTKELVTKKVADSDKIEELVKNALLHRWVNEGRAHHKNRDNNCIFCDNIIEESRWIELDKHFDRESELLEESINLLIVRIEKEGNDIASGFGIKNAAFYSRFHTRLDQLTSEYKTASMQYLDALKILTEQLVSRKNDITAHKDFEPVEDHSKKLQKIRSEYEALRKESNNASDTLTPDQSKAKILLRYDAIDKFVSDINYEEQIKNLEEPDKKRKAAQELIDTLKISITRKLSAIEAKKREMHDEEKGAKKVNEYLTHFFGHNFLTLEARKYIGQDITEEVIYFEVIRDGRKAYHLSEGECRLLAFCYFLAKLDDIETIGTKPILWIDDPISSLDSNHIFFIYSLLLEEVVSKGRFEQLFISTHSLDFLKYLKRLNGKFTNVNQRQQPYEKRFFVIERSWDQSSIKVMPNYLKEYVTEFNYLFNQIYKCSKIEVISDDNYPILYNFPNNARKFLEIYLYYKFPHAGGDRSGEIYYKNMTKFFGNRPIPATLTSRVSNEYSHLAGGLERGAAPINAPEIKEVATSIIESLKNDPDQFDAFLESIGELTTEEVLAIEA